MENKKKTSWSSNLYITVNWNRSSKEINGIGKGTIPDPPTASLAVKPRNNGGSSSLFHHRWSWTVIKSRPEEHSNTKSGGGGDQAWGKEKGGIGIMERRNSRLVDPNYSLRSILTIHRSSCGKSSFLVPWILFTGCLCPKGTIVREPAEGKNGRVAGGGLSSSSPARLSNFSMRV